jgi:hypothetical protein
MNEAQNLTRWSQKKKREKSRSRCLFLSGSGESCRPLDADRTRETCEHRVRPDRAQARNRFYVFLMTRLSLTQPSYSTSLPPTCLVFVLAHSRAPAPGQHRQHAPRCLPTRHEHRQSTARCSARSRSTPSNSISIRIPCRQATAAARHSTSLFIQLAINKSIHLCVCARLTDLSNQQLANLAS